MDQAIRRRGPSYAMLEAEKFFAENSHITGKELSERFKIDQSTIYKADWWIAAKAKQSKVQS